MKIALVVDDSLDRPDGVQQYVRAVGAYLARAGHEVHYVCSGATPEGLEHVHSLARNLRVTFNGNGLRSPLPASRRRLRAFLARERFDVVHVQSPHSPFFAARLVNAARRVQGASVAIVGTFHILPTGRVAAAGTRMLGLLLRRNLARFDRFCAVSAPAATFARQTFGLDPFVIPVGVDLARFRAAPRSAHGDRLRIAFLGRLVARKGVLHLLEAVARLPRETRARVEVVIGGKGPLAPAVAERVDRLGLGETVRLLGFVSEDDKPGFLAQADIAVFPATGGESFGIVLVEAMASGAGCVIGGANPGYLSVLGDDPHVSFDPRDAGGFARLLGRLVDEPDLRRGIGTDQAARVRAFDLEAVGPKLEALYAG